MEDYNKEFQEPTEEEWAEIEELILQEELMELRAHKRERERDLKQFKLWCGENGILWNTQ